jgi:hypothetical protein
MINSDNDFDIRLSEAVENTVNRFIEKENKRPLPSDEYWMSVEVDKRGRLQLGFWRDNTDWFRPALKFDFGKLLAEQLEHLSEEDDWTFEPYRKALERLLRLVDATEKRCREKYESEQAGKNGTTAAGEDARVE